MPRPRVVKDQDTNWTVAVSYERVVVHRGRALGLYVREVRGQWWAAALETVPSVEQTVEAMEAVFDDHGHQVLGSHPNQLGAQRACERYAKKWLANRKKASRCACKPISAAKRVRSTSPTTRRIRSTSQVVRRVDPEKVRKTAKRVH